MQNTKTRRSPWAPPVGEEAAEMAQRMGPAGPDLLRALANDVESDPRHVYGHVTGARLRLLADQLESEAATPVKTVFAFAYVGEGSSPEAISADAALKMQEALNEMGADVAVEEEEPVAVVAPPSLEERLQDALARIDGVRA
jgi:hypothetical protein